MANSFFPQRIVVTPDTLMNVCGNQVVLLDFGGEQYFGLCLIEVY